MIPNVHTGSSMVRPTRRELTRRTTTSGHVMNRAGHGDESCSSDVAACGHRAGGEHRRVHVEGPTIGFCSFDDRAQEETRRAQARQGHA